MPANRFSERAIALIKRFRRDKRANVAVIFGIATLPLISAVGVAVDYSMATRMKAKLQAAADAAAIASIAQKSPGYVAAAAMLSNGSVAAGVADANNVFNGNMNTITGYTNLSVTSTVTKTGTALASTVSFSADVPVTFMKVVGWNVMSISGSSRASGSLPKYLDFYIMLDVSGSMGLPSTTAEAARLQNMNPDNYRQYPTGCTLACHFSQQNGPCTDGGTQGYATNGYCLGYAISRVSPSGYQSLLVTQSSPGAYPYRNPDQNSPNYQKYQWLPSGIVSGLPNSLYAPRVSVPANGGTAALTGGGLTAVSSCPTDGTDNCIQLRLDAVGFALNATQATNGVDGLFATANSTMKVANQFRIGLYPFIRFLDATYSPLTSSINASPTTPGTINYAAANLATQLDTNLNANLGSGGTHIDTAFATMNTTITSVGTGGASNDTQPYVFLVTDGAQDNQIKGVPNGGWSGSNHDTVIDPVAVCKPLKDRGITISVLYIPFQPINPVNASFANDEDDFANNNIPAIPGSLQSCASPNFFFTANTPADITAALKAMFNQAVMTAHITN